MKRILLALVSAVSLLGLVLVPTGRAHASTPVPYPSALRNHPYGQGWTGAQLRTAFVSTSFGPGGCNDSINDPAGMTVSGNSVIMRSNGHDCMYLASPHTYPTVDGYVYEESLSVTSWTPWSAFWGFGNNWPTDGEIDAVEAYPTGMNDVSWHDSVSAPKGYSTCNSVNGCDGGNDPIDTPTNAASLVQGLSPGTTHIVDFAFGGCGAGCGAVSVWYDGNEVAYIHGTNVLNGGSTHDPFWIVDDTGSPGFGSSCPLSPCGGMNVNYLRIFT